MMSGTHDSKYPPMPTFVLDCDKVTVPAGRYAMGDPCYFPYAKGAWDSDDRVQVEFDGGNMGMLDGRECVSLWTAYGDGEYDGTNGTFFVDSGTIGLVRLLDTDLDSILSEDVMVLVTYDAPAVCNAIGGKLYFGHESVDTDPKPEEDDENDDENDEESHPVQCTG